MKADWVRASATGSAGALTLSPVSGYSSFVEAFGSGSIAVPVEYSVYDSAGNFERGYGMLTGSTGVLARSTVIRTRTAAGVLGSGTALTFSGAVTVEVGPNSGSFPQVVPAVWQPGGNRSGEWLTSGLAPLAGITRAISSSVSSGQGYAGDYFIPYLWLGGRPIAKAGIFVTTAAAAGATARIGIYAPQMDGTRKDSASGWSPSTHAPGQPGPLIAEFTGTTQIDVATTGLKYVTLATPLWLPPGWYWAVLCASAAITVTALPTSSTQCGFLGAVCAIAGTSPVYMYNDRAYEAFPSEAMLTTYNSSAPVFSNLGNSTQPAILLST